MVQIFIDQKAYDVEDGITVIQACESAGVEIPRFCYHEKLSIAGNCRMCLVEMENSNKPVASCAMPISEGMNIKTNTEKVEKVSKASTDLRVSPSARKIEYGPEERIRMTRLRLTIAKRLKEAQENAAMLTTFNEVDMSEVIKMRKEYKDEFQKKYSVKLGFMSFFVKASILGLKAYPAVNAEIQNDEIVYKNYYNISIAVGTDKGLVVPVLKNTDEMSFADIEKNIGLLSQKARDGKITIEDLQGGTFTITNGGIYGSMLSTPN